MLKTAILIVLSTLAAGCMHIAGVAEEAPGQPSATAVISIGRPGGIRAATTHRVDSRGRFDFWMSSLDENNVYVYDGQSDPQFTMRRIDRRELSDHMKLAVPSGAGRTNLFPDMP